VTNFASKGPILPQKQRQQTVSVWAVDRTDGLTVKPPDIKVRALGSPPRASTQRRGHRAGNASQVIDSCSLGMQSSGKSAYPDTGRQDLTPERPSACVHVPKSCKLLHTITRIDRCIYTRLRKATWRSTRLCRQACTWLWVVASLLPSSCCFDIAGLLLSELGASCHQST
jgi:hypothetical protein